MDLHSCVVKLRSGQDSGVITGEVPRQNVTTPEILVLQALHGEDGVAQIIKTGNDRRSDRAERDRLAGFYNPGVVKRLFGEAFNALPKKLPARETAPADLEEMAA